MVGVVGFEPTTPASRTQCTFSKLLIFLDVTVVSVTFCSRSFHPFRCDFVAAFANENDAQTACTTKPRRAIRFSLVCCAGSTRGEVILYGNDITNWDEHRIARAGASLMPTRVVKKFERWANL